MQKTSTANERHLDSSACHTQQHAVLTPSHDVSLAARPSVSTVPSSPLTLAPLLVTDSPRSPLSSELSVCSHSAPSSPFFPQHDFSASAHGPSDSACVDGGAPVTAAGVAGANVSCAPRVRVPLSQVVTSLTQRWSMEYLAEAEAGDVDAQCLVAQMYLTGWGALAEDQAEGKRWLARAKEGGIAGTVNKLEQLYLGDGDSSGGGHDGGRRPSEETCGYHSGYAMTPRAEPSAAASTAALAASFMPTPKHSFFASVAATISPKPVVPAPVLRATSPSATSSVRLSMPSSNGSERTAGGSGASSGDEHMLHHSHSPHSLHYHAHHWHMHHARGLSAELGVSAS